MPHYRLIYFDARGRAEVTRQLFLLAGQEFDDVRLSHDEWPKHKAEMPFGQLPVLEVDGKQLPQSHAIARYVARQFGHAGKTPFDEALVDAIADQYKDFDNEAWPFFAILLGIEKGDLEDKLKNAFAPARDKLFTYLTKFLQQNESGYLVGDSLTWADLLLAELDTMSEKIPALYEGFPEMRAHAGKVRSDPILKKWIECRPTSIF
ncbi:Glutathione S-transferase [Trichostrongylus colubriformis]|uniref:glutathione transferase n=1 Tax=Trichostrongylus colubriformis TaxID=6319 RepID=A0AAN8FDY6_TRICO